MFRIIYAKILSVAFCLLIATYVSGQMDTTKTRKPPTEKYCKYTTNGNKVFRCDGEYQNGVLWNGKHYVYDKNGLLIKIEIYRGGKYCGDGQIDY